MSIDSDFSGTTCVVGILRGSELHVCNIGDSRVFLAVRDAGTGALTPMPISRDHKPEIPEERARIVAHGGRVHSVTYADGEEGPQRVWLADVDIPGLAMSRSLGDVVAHSAGVVSTPETHTLRLLPAHAFLVWGSDGLFEFLSNAEVLEILRGAEKGAPVGAGAAAAAGAAAGAGAGADFLKSAMDRMVDESSRRWLANEASAIDDISVIIVQLDVAAEGGSRAGASASSSGGSAGSSGMKGGGTAAALQRPALLGGGGGLAMAASGAGASSGGVGSRPSSGAQKASGGGR